MNLNTTSQNTELTFETEAELMADAIWSELNLDTENPAITADACTIKLGNRFDDMTEEQFNEKKVKRLQRLVQNGEYKLDPTAIAAALLASGDF